MPVNFTLKNVPERLFEKIKAEAARNRRSINGEIVSILAGALWPRRRNPEETLARARELRKLTGAEPMDGEFVAAAKKAGRP